jgi:hypothetical protein
MAILLFHIISAWPSKQPLMVRTFLKVYMELGSYFLFLQEQIKDIIINLQPPQGRGPVSVQDRRDAPRGRRRTAPGTGPRPRPPRRRNLPRHDPCQPQQDGGKGRCPVVSNRPLHRAMQQRCHHASASARSPSSPHAPFSLGCLSSTCLCHLYVPMPLSYFDGLYRRPG